jgi:tetratricopeptide (TPR) repeat protein
LNGGFYLYDILARPLAKPPATIWFAPGTEAIYGEGLVLENRKQFEEALAAQLKVNEIMKDVGLSWNQVGHAYALLGDYPNSYKYLARFGFTGMMDSMNLGELGAAAVRVGKMEDAERILDDALPRYPNHRNVIRINQVSGYAQRALWDVMANKPDQAEVYVKRGLEIMGLIPEKMDEQNEKARRISQANLWGLTGEIALARGDAVAAMKWFQEALKLGPDGVLASRWQYFVAALSPRFFGSQ